mgnify:CR=1 FL=1
MGLEVKRLTLKNPPFAPQQTAAIGFYKILLFAIFSKKYLVRDVSSVEKIINFVRVDRLTNWEDIEAVVFFATPDVLSGLCTWAFYDNDADNAVVTKFASGCAAIISFDTMARTSLNLPLKVHRYLR